MNTDPNSTWVVDINTFIRQVFIHAAEGHEWSAWYYNKTPKTKYQHEFIDSHGSQNMYSYYD
jgi:hypothetical protein